MDWFVRYWLRYFSLGFDLHIWLQAPETGKRAPDQTKKAFTRSPVAVCKDNKARKLFLNIPPLILSLYTSQENHARLGPLLYEMISWCFLFFHFLLSVCECLQLKNVLDRLRLIRALFPGIIISPPSSFKGISSSGLGNSTTSGCCEKTKLAFYGSFTCKEFTHSVCDSRVSLNENKWELLLLWEGKLLCLFSPTIEDLGLLSSTFRYYDQRQFVSVNSPQRNIHPLNVRSKFPLHVRKAVTSAATESNFPHEAV